MIARFVRNINPYPPGAGVTAPSPGVRLVINRQKREGKAVKTEPDRTTPPSKWLWIAKAKVCVYASSWRTCLRWLSPERQRQAQKGLVPGCAVNSCAVCTRMEPGVKHRPKATENGHTERGNPSRALSGNAGAGDQAASRDGVGCPKKQMPGVTPRIR